MKRCALIVLLLCGYAMAEVTHHSFTIDNDSSSALISAGWINSMDASTVYGRVPDIDITIYWTGAITPVKRESRILLRFETLIDSLRAYLESDTGAWTIDSGAASMAIYKTDNDATDSVKFGIIRLGLERHFQRGNGILGSDSGGVAWGACISPEGSGWLDTIPWTTAGAKGEGDTLGGIIYETDWITIADTTGDRITWKLPGASLQDTTVANYSDWLLYVTQYITQDSTNLAGVGRTFCSGYHGGAFEDPVYCNWEGCEPAITVWLSFYQNTYPDLQSIGHEVKSIGREIKTIGR